MDYFKNKDLLSKKAVVHTNEMERTYKNEIAACVKATKVYDHFDMDVSEKKKYKTKILVDDADSVSAIMYHHSGRTCVLNFASFKNPGGMFEDGSCAQEESLCHESFLYNVLRLHMGFYRENKRYLNGSLYTDRGLYSPDVVFMHHLDVINCDVITMAAPNKGAAQKYQNVPDTTNTAALESRIRQVLLMAADNNVETLILGAYGCGVFKQDPDEVAAIFKKYLKGEFNGVFRKVVFAIPATGKNIEAFEKHFSWRIKKPKEPVWN